MMRYVSEPPSPLPFPNGWAGMALSCARCAPPSCSLAAPPRAGALRPMFELSERALARAVVALLQSIARLGTRKRSVPRLRAADHRRLAQERKKSNSPPSRACCGPPAALLRLPGLGGCMHASGVGGRSSQLRAGRRCCGRVHVVLVPLHSLPSVAGCGALPRPMAHGCSICTLAERRQKVTAAARRRACELEARGLRAHGACSSAAYAALVWGWRQLLPAPRG